MAKRLENTLHMEGLRVGLAQPEQKDSGESVAVFGYIMQCMQKIELF